MKKYGVQNLLQRLLQCPFWHLCFFLLLVEFLAGICIVVTTAQPSVQVEKWKGEQRGVQAGKQAAGKQGVGAVIFYDVNSFIILKKWKINVFPYNFLMNKDRNLGNVASERRFQDLSKSLKFFENQLNFGGDMSKDS